MVTRTKFLRYEYITHVLADLSQWQRVEEAEERLIADIEYALQGYLDELKKDLDFLL